jgi:SAM-dependent methyltransferase
LEIGCGIGRLFAGLAARFGEVWGTDISRSMIDFGRRHCPVGATWFLGDGASLDGIDDGSVDHVLSYEVFGHIPDLGIIRNYLRETFRVLRPGKTFQIQLRCRSDSLPQAIVRALPRRPRVVVGTLLQRVRVVPVRGDIDTWLGRLVPPETAVGFAEQLGFVDVSTLPSDPQRVDSRRARGYWIVGRRPPAPTESS